MSKMPQMKTGNDHGADAKTQRGSPGAQSHKDQSHSQAHPDKSRGPGASSEKPARGEREKDDTKSDKKPASGR